MNKEFYILRYERTEYAKRIRKDYESKRIKERRCNMRKWGIRHDGLCNTLSTVQKDNYLLEVTYKDDRDMNNEPFIVASRGRNPENPSDRTTGSPTEQRLEPNTKGLCNTLTTVQKDNYVAEPKQSNLRIRKLTPKECWRLMGFDDEDFYKAKWMKNLSYLVGGRKCSVKLKVVKEKQKLTDTETYVLCTTRDSRDMETLRTILKSSVDKQENENQANVNIAIEWLDGMEHSECATNIIRCIDYMGMHFIMITGKEPQATDIIVQARVDNTSTGRFMKITTESNLNQSKLYTILTLFALIIESKIFTATTQQANINGCITLIEDCEKNVLMKISNLRMESIRERTSNSALYKQAGNSIVVDVLEALFTNLRPYLEG